MQRMLCSWKLLLFKALGSLWLSGTVQLIVWAFLCYLFLTNLVCLKFCYTIYLFLGQPQVNKVKNFLSFFKVSEMSTNQISRSYHDRLPSYYVKINSKFIIRPKFFVKSNLSCSTVFFLHQYFIETTTTDFDMYLHV